MQQLNYNLDVSNDSKWIICTPNREAKELLLHVSEIGHFYAGPNFYTDRAGKKEYYIIYTVSGCGVMRHKGQKLILSKHEAVLIYCEEHQFYGTISDEIWDHYWVHFNGSGAENYYNLINEDGISRIQIEDTDGFVENMEGIMRNSGALDMRQSVMSSMHVTNLLTMLAMGKYDVKNVRPLTEHEDTLNRVIMYIKDHYAQNIALRDLVDVANMSTSYFTKLFRQYTGMTPHEYLINYRVNQAKKVLRHTTDSVAQVAVRVGFQDVCNFTRTFRRITGTTPRDFRRSGS